MSPLFIALLTFVPTSLLFFAMGVWYGARANREQTRPDLAALPFPPVPKLPPFDEDAKSEAQEADKAASDADGSKDPRDLSPVNQLEEAGYECQEMDEENFESALANEFNFADVDDGITCRVCRTIYLPIRVWGTSKTQRQGLIGFFCAECGCGFTASYSTRNGAISNEPSTVHGFLRPEPAPVIGLTSATKSSPNIGGDTTL